MKNFDKYILVERATVKDALIALNNLSGDNAQTLFVVDNSRKITGSLTDGDVRRGLIKGYTLDHSVMDIMNRDFSYIFENKEDVSEIRDMRSKKIKLLPVLNKNGEITDILDLKNNISVLPVDAILMAGGKGERLKPLTEKIPKPLLEVGGKAIIDYNIKNLLLYGVKHISVTVNYQREQIEKHIEREFQDVKITCVREPEYLGTMGSVKLIDSLFHDTCLIMNSDLFTNINLEHFFLHFQKHQAEMSIAVIPYSVSVPYGIFELDGRNIIGLKEKPTYDYFANAGIYLVKKTILELIPRNTYYDATDLMECLIEKKRKIIRFPLTGYWIDIGKQEDYKKAQELVKHL